MAVYLLYDQDNFIASKYLHIMRIIITFKLFAHRQISSRLQMSEMVQHFRAKLKFWSCLYILQ